MTHSIGGYLGFSLLVLLGIALLAGSLPYLARRAGVGQPLGPVELLARLPLEARRSVYVVRVVDQILILGASEAGLSKLGELSEAAVAGLPSRSGSFSSALRAALARPAAARTPQRPHAEADAAPGELLRSRP